MAASLFVSDYSTTHASIWQMVTTSGRLSTTFNKCKVAYVSSLVDVDDVWLQQKAPKMWAR